MDSILGFSAAVATAVCKSGTDLTTKFASRTLPERLQLVVQWATGAIVLWMACLIWRPTLLSAFVPTFSSMIRPGFWWVLITSGALNAAASYFYIRAFRYSDASLVAPLMLFTPVLLLVTSPLMLGEHIPALGIVGVLCTVVGAFFLGSERGARQRLASVKILLQDKGARSMLVTAAIWSVTSNLDKLGIERAPILLWSASITSCIALYSIAFLLAMDGLPKLSGAWKGTLPGTINALGIALQMYALTTLYVPYVIAIKRMSSLLTVAASGALFKENTRNRLIGTVIMLSGTVLLAFGR